MLVLPFRGNQGINIINRSKNDLSKKVPSSIKTDVVFNVKCLSAFFDIKDKIHTKHVVDIIMSTTKCLALKRIAMQTMLVKLAGDLW